MRKDAKIAICVILVLMVLVVIIWGRSPRPDADLEGQELLAPGTDSVIATTDTAPPADTAVSTLGGDAPPADLDTVRRDAPSQPPADTASSPPIAMINHLPDHPATTQPPTALDSLTAERTDAEAREPFAPSGPSPPLKPQYLATHKIVKGDNYTKLATHYYKDPNKWRLIYEANKIPPQSLRIGQAIKIPHPPATSPAVAATTPDRAPAAPTAPRDEPSRRTYKVRKGDSFYSIAREVYRDPTKWKRLYEHNRTRLPNPRSPNSLRAGTVIDLPNLASAQ